MRIFAIIISIASLLGLDQVSKWYFGGYFQSKIFDCFPLVPECVYRYVPIFSEYLGIELSYNRGVAFSLPITGIPLQIITIGLIIGLFWFYIREEYSKRSYLLDSGYALIGAGALAHAYERVSLGYVVDFIAVKYFAILNFADIFISTGGFLIILFYVYDSRKHR